MALDAADIPASQLRESDAMAERLQYLIEQRDGMVILPEESGFDKEVRHG